MADSVDSAPHFVILQILCLIVGGFDFDSFPLGIRFDAFHWGRSFFVSLVDVGLNFADLG